MARNNRKDIESAFLHVMLRGNNKEYIFKDEQSKITLLNYLIMAKAEHAVSVLGYCIMDSHAHLLVKVPDVQVLSEYMHKVNLKYSKYYNENFNHTGHVFRDRFRSEEIKDESYLVRCLAYIHNNPLKAGMVQSLDNYKYSSFYDYTVLPRLINPNAAKEYYDISAESIRLITTEYGDTKWMDEEPPTEDLNTVLTELILRYQIIDARQLHGKPELIEKMVAELRSRCGASYDKLAEIFGIARTTLRKLLE